MFNINYRSDCSLKDLKDLQNKGVSILRSAHIGNFNKATLLLAQVGFPILLHEHLPGNASIYEPAYIKKQDGKVLVSSNPEVSQLHDNSFPKDIIMDGKHFQIPSQFHYHTLKKQFPNVFLSSEVFLQQQIFVIRVLELLVEDFPSMFHKYQEKDGSVLNFSHTTNSSIIYRKDDFQKAIPLSEVVLEVLNNFHQTQNCIKNQGDNPQGIIMHSLLYILLSTLVEIYKDRNGLQRFHPEKVDVIHFSGTQMINYLLNNRSLAQENIEGLNAMYKKLQIGFCNILPLEVDFHLVQTSILNFLSTYSPDKHQALDSLLNNAINIKNIDELNNEKKRGFAIRIMAEIHAMSNGEIMARIAYYRANITTIVGSGKKKVSELETLCSDIGSNIKKIIGHMVSIETTLNDLYASDESQILYNKSQKARSAFIYNSQSIEEENAVQITQYDLLQEDRHLYIPESAWNIPFNDFEKALRLYRK